MSNTIHGASHKALKFMRQHPATLAVLWVFISRTNYENVAFPSLRGLAKDTGWSKSECAEARSWLVEKRALEVVDGYVRPEWRKLDAQKRSQRVNFDKAEYFRPTGQIEIDGVSYPILYFGQSEGSDIEQPDPLTDVLQQRTSVPSGHPSPADIMPHGTELNTNKDQRDSKELELDSLKAAAATPPQSTNAFGLYERNIGVLTPLIADELKDLLKEYPPEWVSDAIKETALSGGRSPKYMRRVLERWHKEGKSTLKAPPAANNSRPSAIPVKPRQVRDPALNGFDARQMVAEMERAGQNDKGWNPFANDDEVNQNDHTQSAQTS